jgi:hypothetical protein
VSRPLCNNVTYKGVREYIIGATRLSRTDVEESSKIVVLGLGDTGLFEQAENSGVSQSGFVDLEKLEVVNERSNNELTKSSRLIAESSPKIRQYNLRLSFFSFSVVSGPTESP